MNEQFTQLIERIDAMELRQRVLLLAAGLTLLFFVADTFAIQPALNKQKASTQAIDEWESRLDLLRHRTGMLSGLSPENQRSELQAQLDDLDAQLDERLGGLLAPDQAMDVLEQVLEQEQGLVLREVNASNKPLSGTELLDRDDATRDDNPFSPGAGNNDELLSTGIGRYQLQLQLEGSYLATLRYLRALEALPWKFFWESVDYEVTEYPAARITLDIYTLGIIGESI